LIFVVSIWHEHSSSTANTISHKRNLPCHSAKGNFLSGEEYRISRFKETEFCQTLQIVRAKPGMRGVINY